MPETRIFQGITFCLTCGQAHEGSHECIGHPLTRLFHFPAAPLPTLTAPVEMSQPESRELTFYEWMRVVNVNLRFAAGVDIASLGDALYWDMWDDSILPRDAAVEVLKQNDFPFDGEEA